MASTTGSNYWLVACPVPEHQSKESMLSILKSRIYDSQNLCERDFQPVKFDVPDGASSLKFGSFDNLIKLMDDLVKHDAQVEQVLRRMERQTLDLIPDVNFKVLTQREFVLLENYLRKFTWDDAKYPKARQITDNLQVILAAISKLDEEVRNKTTQLQEVKAQLSAVTKREGGSLTSAEMVDILTPEVVVDHGREDPGSDFIFSEHLCTVVCVVPRGGEKTFQKNYQEWNEAPMTEPLTSRGVVPRSAKQFISEATRGPITDREGNTLWRVVLFRGGVHEFKKEASENHVVVREFEYSAENYQRMLDSRVEKKQKCMEHEKFLRKICQATFSDTLVAWMHIKAIRIFVESVLRFGVPPRFAAFMIKPKQTAGAVTQLRAALSDLYSNHSQFGFSYADQQAEAEGEEYYPYVSLAMAPLVIGRGA